MHGLLALGLINLIFTVSICQFSLIYLSGSCSNSWTVLYLTLLHTAVSDSPCCIPCISSHILAILMWLVGSAAFTQDCLALLWFLLVFFFFFEWMALNSWFTLKLCRTGVCVLWASTHLVHRSIWSLVKYLFSLYLCVPYLFQWSCHHHLVHV